jgi:hypothetical protein
VARPSPPEDRRPSGSWQLWLVTIGPIALAPPCRLAPCSLMAHRLAYLP